MSVYEKDATEVSIKVFLFNGKKEEWVKWEEKFLSRAKSLVAFSDFCSERKFSEIPTEIPTFGISDHFRSEINTISEKINRLEGQVCSTNRTNND
jgi:hypothetical protein